MALASFAAILALIGGLPVGGSEATSIGCLALLVFGLPHGALDLELIKTRSRGPWTSVVSLLVLYLGCAAAMATVWAAAPVMALTIFIVIAVMHFSEDWEGASAPVLGLGLALALLASPSFLHRAELDALFIGLTDRPGATAVTDALTLMAPVSGILGLVALSTLWSNGRRAQALAGGIALLGMVVLPPVVGFALYFCLFHSPRHLGEGLRNLRFTPRRAWLWIIVPLTLAAGVLAAAIYGLELRAYQDSRIVAASFMTLSILTLPHMLVPVLVDLLSRVGLSDQKDRLDSAHLWTGANLWRVRPITSPRPPS